MKIFTKIIPFHFITQVQICFFLFCIFSSSRLSLFPLSLYFSNNVMKSTHLGGYTKLYANKINYFFDSLYLSYTQIINCFLTFLHRVLWGMSYFLLASIMLSTPRNNNVMRNIYIQFWIVLWHYFCSGLIKRWRQYLSCVKAFGETNTWENSNKKFNYKIKLFDFVSYT